MALPSVPEEKEQGAVQEEEALMAAAPPPLEPTPVQADEAAMAAAVPPAPAEQPAQQAPPAQPGYTVKNPYMLLPPRANLAKFNGPTPKSAVERAYDIGLFWQVLASDPRASNLTRMVARGLTGRKR